MDRCPVGAESVMTRSEEIDAALETASRCRLQASRAKQLGFIEFARWLNKNAGNAESWAARYKIAIVSKEANQ